MSNKKILPALFASALLTFSLNSYAMVTDESINNYPTEQIRNAKIEDKTTVEDSSVNNNPGETVSRAKKTSNAMKVKYKKTQTKPNS